MYENNNTVSIDWKGLFVKLIIVAVIIFVIFACYNYFSSNKKGLTTTSTPTAATQLFNANLESLRQAGENYYDYSNYPSEGQTVMVTLGELITKGNIKELYDANGNECNRENSYVALTNDKGQYKLKASLACGETSNYTVVMIGCDCEENVCSKETKEEETKENTNKTTSPSKKTTAAIKTTKKKNTTNNNVVKPTTKAPTTTTKKTTQVIDMSNSTTTKVPTTTTKEMLYKVTFDSNGGDYVEPQYVEKYETAYEPDEPEKDDARFVGWYYKGKLWDFDNEITKNITLEAYYWETKTITTTVYSSGYDTVGTTFMTVTHKLAIPAILQQNNIKNVRIRRLENERTLATSYDLQNYINKHSQTYDGYIHSAGDYYSTNANTLGRLTNIKAQKTYPYTYDRWVTWSALVSNQCYQPFTINGSNKCSYGIAYNVIWEYEELTD